MAYGTISCLQSSAPVLTVIDNKMVGRMPGETFAEKCAWAARINRDHVFAVTSGAPPKCNSSKIFKVKPVFDAVNQMVCSDTPEERELFFVGGMVLRNN